MEFTVMNKNSHLTFEKYVAPLFGILWNWIFYYCVYYFLCNTDKMQGSHFEIQCPS